MFIFLGAVVVVVLLVISLNNKLVRLREMYNNAKAQISPQLESRWDALSSIISAVGKYSAHERETLEEVIGKRTKITSTSSVADMKKDDEMYGMALGTINAVAESYPDLKASSLYESAMESINMYEDKVRHARMILQDTATKYNIAIKVFPASIIAGILGFTEAEYFEHTEVKSDMPSWN